MNIDRTSHVEVRLIAALLNNYLRPIPLSEMDAEQFRKLSPQNKGQCGSEVLIVLGSAGYAAIEQSE